MRLFSSIAIIFVFSVTVIGQEAKKSIELPKPQMEGGKPLMQALKERKSTREFDSKELTPQMLSNLLWAACGVNRIDSGKRTAPTAANLQEIDVYAAMKDGLYIFDAKKHSLNLAVAKDIRSIAGKQDFVKTAPVVLIYVVDFSRIQKFGIQKEFYSAVDTGFISQNVYLFCSSEGLATVVLGFVDRSDLFKEMKLKPEQKVVLSQPVGYPKK